MRTIKEYGQCFLIYRGTRIPVKNFSDAEILRAAATVDNARRVARNPSYDQGARI
jgi:hypothetical protein